MNSVCWVVNYNIIRLLVAFLSSTFLLQAQTEENRLELNGQLLNSESKPLFDELIYLYGADSSLVKTEFTNEKGEFTFRVPPQSYFLVVKNSGFESYFGELLRIESNTKIAPIVLQSRQQVLGEVEVRAKVPLVERSAGKMVINVEQSLQSTGSSAFEIIDKSPGVTVSMTDQISVNGRQGVVVQVNGKALQMSGSDLANYLRGIPSSTIDKIEFLTNPSAKYDAAGALVIDIKLKKDARFGTNGSVNASFGHGYYPKYSAGLQLNHRTQKWNFFGNYSYSYRKGFNHLQLERKFYHQDTFHLAYDQNNYLVFPFVNQLARAGFDYEINATSNLSFSINTVANGFTRDGHNTSDVYNKDFIKVSSFTTDNGGYNRWSNGGGNLIYTKKTDTLGSNFSIDADYTQFFNRSEQFVTSRYFNSSGEEYQTPYDLYGDLKGGLSIYALKYDQTKIINPKMQLEFGAKGSYVEADNNVKFYDQSNDASVYDSLKSNHFLYTENINAGYVNFNLSAEKWTLQLGVRAENTNIVGKQIVNNEQFDSSYIQLFPSISTRWTINKKHSLDFNVNRRINRPGYGQLNPFKYYLDPTTFRQGNPYLKPQTTVTAEMGHTFLEKFYTQIGLSRTYNNIVEIIAPSAQAQNVTIQSSINLKSTDMVYSNVSYPFDLTKWWSLRMDAGAYLALYSGTAANTQLSQVGTINGFVNLTQQFKLGKMHSFELTAQAQSRERYAFDLIRPRGGVGLAYQVKIWKNKANVRFNVTDIFYTEPISATVEFTDYKERFLVRRETRVATVSFTYRFGTAQSPMRRRGSGADDIKQRAGGGIG